MATPSGKGFLLVMMECPPSLEDEFNAWYDTEHLAERLGVPGFETAIRFVAQEGHPRYLAMYDLDQLDVLQSPAYVKVGYGNASPWTKRVTSRVRVWRSSGTQVHPRNVITRRAPRVTLVRFAGLNSDAEKAIVAGTKAAFGERPETLQARVLAYEADGSSGYMVFVEHRAPFASPLDLKAFGVHADAVDLVNVYALY